MDIAAARLKGRQTRHRRIRKKISGTNLRPRLAVFRSARHIYVQAIDDDQGNTLACSSTLVIQKSLKKIYSGNKEAAKAVGADIAKNFLINRFLLRSSTEVDMFFMGVFRLWLKEQGKPA